MMATLLVVADRAPLHLDSRLDPRSEGLGIAGDFTRYLDGIITGALPGPYAYRVLIPHLLKFGNGFSPGSSPILIDAILKGMILLLIQIAAFRYLARFVPRMAAVAGVAGLGVVIGYALSYYQGPSVGETTDLFNLLMFLFALTLLHDFWLGKAGAGTTALLAGTLFAGALNKETILFILPVIVVLVARKRMTPVPALVCLLAAAAGFLPPRLTLEVGTAFPPERSGWLTTEGLARNFPFLDPALTGTVLVGNFRTLVLLGPLLWLALREFRAQDGFLRAAFVAVPVYIAGHYIFSTIIEARVWLPVVAMLLPMSMRGLGMSLAETGGRKTSPARADDQR